MRIRKNSLIDIDVKVVMAVSFIMLFAEAKLSVVGVGIYMLNLVILWFTATVETYFITEGRK